MKTRMVWSWHGTVRFVLSAMSCALALTYLNKPTQQIGINLLICLAIATHFFFEAMQSNIQVEVEQ